MIIQLISIAKADSRSLGSAHLAKSVINALKLPVSLPLHSDCDRWRTAIATTAPTTKHGKD